MEAAEPDLKDAMTPQSRTRTVLAWALWLATMSACVAGLVVALLVARPLTAQVIGDGALDALNRELLAVVDQTMQPTSTSLWLRSVP